MTQDQMTQEPTIRYIIDWEKVKTLKDLLKLLSSFNLDFTQEYYDDKPNMQKFLQRVEAGKGG